MRNSKTLNTWQEGIAIVKQVYRLAELLSLLAVGDLFLAVGLSACQPDRIKTD